MKYGDEPEKRSCALVVRVVDEPKPKKLERRAGNNVIRLVSSHDDPKDKAVTEETSD